MMSNRLAARLQEISTFEELLAYLRDELDWPIERDHLVDLDRLKFDFEPEELGIDEANAAKIRKISRMRPLDTHQPWGIFLLELEPKKLPIVVLRKILSKVVLKDRAAANRNDQVAWQADDILFVSNFGESGKRQISFVHFEAPEDKNELPVVKVLGWDESDTRLKVDWIVEKLDSNLRWPDDTTDHDAWRDTWRKAFMLRHRQVIQDSQTMALELAELAKRIRQRIRDVLAVETAKGPMTRLMKAFRESLVSDLDADGFSDMYAQTITYGLLSARIADPSKQSVDDLAAHMRTSPFLRELMEYFLHVGGRKGKAGSPGVDFDELGVSEVVELLDDTDMEAVIRDFGDRNKQEDPVMHFFEGFLQAYDRKIKKDRGVFYTPQPVVSYIVRSVHELLQSEFGLEDGLADTVSWGEMIERHSELKLPLLTDEPGEQRTISHDEPFVQILDPATGTATFLVEVIDVIHCTLTDKWKRERLSEARQREAWNDYVPKHLLPRLFAYELMMAPYAIAHMKVSLKLQETGYDFGSDERAQIYLTNALEPWQRQLKLPELEALAHEAAAVNEVKRYTRFTVIIGNPPYSGEGMNKGDWIRGLIETYMFVDGVHLGEKGKKNWLQDDYVKFIRYAQSELDSPMLGILGFVTNHSFLDSPTFRGMRASLRNSFQRIHVLDLHGNSKKLECGPNGEVDENVFDIQQGVSIGLFRRTPETNSKTVAHAHLWGLRGDVSKTRHSGKYGWLSHSSMVSTDWNELSPNAPFYLFVPQDIGLRSEYEEYWKLTDVMPHYGLGIITSRDHFVIDFEDSQLSKRLEVFRDRTVPDEWIRSHFEIKDNSMWSMEEARKKFRRKPIQSELFLDVLYRPYDRRRIYFETNVVFNMRTQIMRHMTAGPNFRLMRKSPS